MKEGAIKILEILEDNGFKGYIVGGYVRDQILGRVSLDVDITTNATNKDIMELFHDFDFSLNPFLGVVITINGHEYTLTTFRKDTGVDKRKPQVEYVEELKDDLLRRDFYMNTLCMDKNFLIIDLLGGHKDIALREINVVGDAFLSLKEDPLRILRAIRFATVLQFTLGKETKDSIIKNKLYLKDISYERKKEELDKIFSSSNRQYGVSLIKDLGLDEYLEIYNIKDIALNTDLIGVWASLKVSPKYPFTKNEKKLILDIKSYLDLNMYDAYNLYKYGLYVAKVASNIKGLDSDIIQKLYKELPINNFSEIKLDSQDIIKIMNKEPGPYISEIYEDIEKEIVYGNLVNTSENILEYIKGKYK